MSVERDLRQSLASATETVVQVERQKAALEAQTIEALQCMRAQLESESRMHIEAEALLVETVGALQQQLQKSVHDMQALQADCEQRLVAMVRRIRGLPPWECFRVSLELGVLSRTSFASTSYVNVM